MNNERNLQQITRWSDIKRLVIMTAISSIIGAVAVILTFVLLSNMSMGLQYLLVFTITISTLVAGMGLLGMLVKTITFSTSKKRLIEQNLVRYTRETDTMIDAMCEELSLPNRNDDVEFDSNKKNSRSEP